MPYLSRHRLASAVPHYGIPISVSLRGNGPHTTFAAELRHARIARATDVTHAAETRARHTSSVVWPTAFAMMLVAANMGTSTALSTPEPQSPQDSLPGALGDGGVVPATPTASPVGTQTMSEGEHAEVVRVPMEHSSIRTQYTFGDVLRAIAAGDQPFRKLSESICDAHAILSGETLDPQTCATLKKIASLIDSATSLIPQVQQMRIPSHLAGRIADEVEDIAPASGELDETLQLVDPRNFAEPQGMRGTQRGTNVPFMPEEDTLARQVPAKSPNADVADDAGETNEADEASEVDEAGNAGEDHGIDSVEDAVAPRHSPLRQYHAHDTGGAPSHAISPGSRGREMANHTPADFRIKDERQFLSGYEQALPSVRLPADPRARLMVANGHYYIRGELGYYRATRARDGHHWLVDAPQKGETRAQVPVTYNKTTAEWQAYAPLRLCGGGGCAPSREASPDSIAMKYQQIADAVRHIPEEPVRTAIERAFHDVSRMALVRSNREDLRQMRDNSIVGHRAALTPTMKRINQKASLFIQQREAALSTTTHYYWNREAEAFCQENAEVLFHYLLDNGVPGDRIRMITVQPRNRAPHVMVLYTESPVFIDLLELATPQPPVAGYIDGIDDVSFAGWVSMTRDSTLLLDPWSTVKATSFVDTTTEHELVDELNAALADTGHRPGNPYVVSITRPFGGRRTLANRRGSMVSLGSSGGSDSPGNSGRASSTSGSGSGVVAV